MKYDPFIVRSWRISGSFLSCSPPMNLTGGRDTFHRVPIVLGTSLKLGSEWNRSLTGLGSVARLLWIGLALWLALPLVAWPAASNEEIAFNAAARAFEDGFYDRAEKGFAEYVKKYPASERVSEAVLKQAQARQKLGQHDLAIGLLSTNLSQAGKLADRFRFGIGEAQFQRGDFAAAAAAYAQMLKDYPESPLRANASFGEALSWFQQGNLGKTIDLLCQTNSPFQQLAQSWTNDPYVWRGQLLLGEAMMLKPDYAAAEAVLQSLAERPLPPALAWQRHFLLARVQMARQQPATVLPWISNLVALAKASGLVNQQSETVLLHGEALQMSQQPEAAELVYEQNLASMPLPARRQILSRLVALYLAGGKTDKAMLAMETIIKDYPEDRELDMICLTLGELRLGYFRKRQLGKTPEERQSATNQLPLALGYFDRVLTNFPGSPLLGKAYLNRGWCLWESGQIKESQAAFQEAAKRLPLSTNQAMARFKWADAQFQLKDYTNAATNYSAVLDLYAAVTNLSPALLEQAAYQLVRTRMELGDYAGCTNALDQLLARYPQSEFADRGLMNVGQWLIRQGKIEEGRSWLSQLVRRYPHSALAPEAQMGIAQTLVEQQKWPEALEQYDAWVARYTNHSALPQVEFGRALSYHRAGRDTNAIQFFSQFMERCPRHSLAPYAQYFIADYYFNQGKYPEAEKNYQLLYQNTNWPVSEVTYQAHLGAGRAAFMRQSYTDATNYFVVLINLLRNDTNSPSSLLPAAYVAFGDTLKDMSVGESTNGLQRYAEAINAYYQVPETNALAPLAWGLMADCHLQLATQDSARYLQASNYYQRVINATNADMTARSDVTARSQAEVKLGTVYEKMAQLAPPTERSLLLTNALNLYLNVVYGNNLRPGELRDNFWSARAGLVDAPRILEDQGRWTEVVNLYQRLLTFLPPNWRPVIEKKLEQARKRL